LGNNLILVIVGSKQQSFRGLENTIIPDNGNDFTPNSPETRLFMPFGCTMR